MAPLSVFAMRNLVHAIVFLVLSFLGMAGLLTISRSARPVAREELLARDWGNANHLEIETRTVDIHIAKLRRKIEQDPASPQAIVTVRGAGYRLMLQAQ